MQVSLALSYTEAGMLVTGAGALRVPGSFIAGMLASRYSSRIIIGTSTLIAGVAMFLLGAAPTFLIALVAMFGMGVTSGAALTPMMGLLSPWFDARQRGLVAGIAAAGGSLAFVVAGVLVPWLITRNPGVGWRHSWYLFGMGALAVGSLSLIFLRDRPYQFSSSRSQPASQQRSYGSWPVATYQNPLVWLVTLLVFCSGWSQGIFNTFFGTYLSQENAIDLTEVGQLLILIGSLSVGSGIIWGRISDWIGRGQAFLLAFLVQGISFALIWLIPVWGAFVIAAVLMGLTLRATFTICAAAAGDYVPVQFAAAAFALMSAGASLGNALSPALTGAIADASGTLRGAFALAMGGTVAGAAGSLLLCRATTVRDRQLSQLNAD
jgi:MFS family permease